MVKGEPDIVEQTHRNDKVLLTVIILLSYLGLGLILGQEGVIFLDLLLILQEDIERGSLLFLLSSPGFMIGSLVGGVLYDKFQPGFIYMASLVGAGIFSYLIPYCLSLPLMGFVMMVRSAFTGSVATGGTFLIVILWKPAANPLIQLLHFTMAVGALVIPLITEPFLATKQDSNSEPCNGSFEGNTTFLTPNRGNDSEIMEALSNFSTSFAEFGNKSLASCTESSLIAHNNSLTDTLQNLSNNSSDVDVSRSTNVHYALMVTGSYAILACVPFVYFALSGKLKMLDLHKSHVAENGDSSTRSHFFKRCFVKTSCRTLWTYVLVCLLYFTYGGIEKGCSTFLMPYAVEFLRMSKTKGAHLMSAFWTAFAVFRFAGIFIAKVLSASKMLFLDYFVLIAGLCVLFVASADSYIALWIASVLIGAGQAGIFPTAVAWINKNLMPVTGLLSALLCISLATGSLVYLPLLGHLFEEVSPLSFIYLTLGFSVFGFLVFLTMFMIRPKNKPDGQKTEIEITEGGNETAPSGAETISISQA